MGGDVSPAEPADSAAGLYKVITGTPPKALRFYDFEARTLPWQRGLLRGRKDLLPIRGIVGRIGRV
jgi:hypothetical protein